MNVAIGRRRFISGAACATASVGIGSTAVRSLRVGVLSDTHITEDPASIVLPEQAFRVFRHFSVDAVVHLGDIGNRSCPKGYALYRAAFDKVFVDGKKPRELYVYAGHDAFGLKGTAKLEAYARLKREIGATNERSDFRELKGFPFLVFPQEIDLDDYEKRIGQACRRYPSGPVFVLDHVPGFGTTDGSVRWGDWKRRCILDKYPRVVKLSGHSHGSMRNEALIWQGNYTEINFGCISSLKGWEADLVGNGMNRIFAGDVAIMDVDDDAIEVRRICARNMQEVCADRRWRVPLPFVKDDAPYQPAKRATESSPPEVPSSWSVSCRTIPSPEAGVEISFPALDESSGIFKYRIEMENSVDGCIIVREVLSPHIAPGGNGMVRAVFGAELLPSGMACVAKVTPLNTWNVGARKGSVRFTAPGSRFQSVYDGVAGVAADEDGAAVQEDGWTQVRGWANVNIPAQVWRGRAGTRFSVSFDVEADRPENTFLTLGLYGIDGKIRAAPQPLAFRDGRVIRYAFEVVKKRDDEIFLPKFRSVGCTKVRLSRMCAKTADGASFDLPADFKSDPNADVSKIVR